jgi:hypothetical protein
LDCRRGLERMKRCPLLHLKRKEVSALHTNKDSIIKITQVNSKCHFYVVVPFGVEDLLSCVGRGRSISRGNFPASTVGIFSSVKLRCGGDKSLASDDVDSPIAAGDNRLSTAVDVDVDVEVFSERAEEG